MHEHFPRERLMALIITVREDDIVDVRAGNHRIGVSARKVGGQVRLAFHADQTVRISRFTSGCYGCGVFLDNNGFIVAVGEHQERRLCRHCIDSLDAGAKITSQYGTILSGKPRVIGTTSDIIRESEQEK